MPRYFFHILGREGLLGRDHQGFDFPDLEAARSEARQLAEDMAFDAASEGANCRESIEVTDDRGSVLMRLACVDEQ